jgi:hypothetical protein
MGLFSLFGKGPLSEKRIAKVSKLAANPFAQPDVRMREMSRLMQDGSEGALRGVLRRFAANAQGHIADEDEKKWLEDALVAHGDDALGPLRDYIATEEKLTYALRAYRRIAGEVNGVGYFLEVLRRYGPDDYRSSEAKLQLLWQLSETLQDERVVPALAPFLLDHSDDVRWAVMDLMERAADSGLMSPELHGRMVAEMAKLVTQADVSPRISRRAAELLAAREWALPSGTPEVLAAGLGDAFFLDKKRFVRRRTKKG